MFVYSGALLIRTVNTWENHANYPSMRIIGTYFTLCLVNGGELCTGQSYELPRRYELVRVKLSGLYCTCNLFSSLLDIEDSVRVCVCVAALKAIVTRYTAQDVMQTCMFPR